MRTLESSSNPRIQNARKVLARKDPGLFVIEGTKLFEEAIQSRMTFEEVFVTREAWNRNQNTMERLERENIAINFISARLAKHVSDLDTPPGLTAILRRPAPTKTAIRNASIFLVGLRDPGNAGTIIRSAEATGCDMVFYSSDCADPFQPKVVRASMGSIFRLPLIEIPDVYGFLNQQKTEQIRVCALVSIGGIRLDQWKPSLPVMVCVGSESHGLPADLPITERVSIPMEGKAESLNAAVAASVCLYWVRLACRNQN